MLQKINFIKYYLSKNTPIFLRRLVKPILSVVLIFAIALTTLVYATHTIRIFDGITTYFISSFSSSPHKALQRIPLKNEYEITNISKGLYSTDVTISYLIPLTITVGNESNVYKVPSDTLGNILTKLGIKVDDYDIVSHSLNAKITAEEYIDIVDIEYKTETFSESIPFTSNIDYTPKYNTNYNRVVKSGENGSKIVTCSVQYINGVATNKTVLSEEIVKPSVPEYKIVGTSTPVTYSANSVSTISKLTAPSNLRLDENGIPTEYSSVKTLRATAYTHTGNPCSTGVMPTPGYVAVDPKEIPYGTKMYIVSADGKYVYGYAIAADTGGFIHGTRTDMDLFFDTRSECINFGRRNIKVYFLK